MHQQMANKTLAQKDYPNSQTYLHMALGFHWILLTTTINVKFVFHQSVINVRIERRGIEETNSDFHELPMFHGISERFRQICPK